MKKEITNKMNQPSICKCSCGYDICIFADHPNYKDCKECFDELKKEFKQYLKELKENEQK